MGKPLGNEPPDWKGKPVGKAAPEVGKGMLAAGAVSDGRADEIATSLENAASLEIGASLEAGATVVAVIEETGTSVETGASLTTADEVAAAEDDNSVGAGRAPPELANSKEGNAVSTGISALAEETDAPAAVVATAVVVAAEEVASSCATELATEVA